MTRLRTVSSALLAAALLAGCSAAAPSAAAPSALPSSEKQSPAPSASSSAAQSPSPTPAPPSATAGAAPAPSSTAPSPSLLLRVVFCSDVCGPDPGTRFLSDGRVIWLTAPTGAGSGRLVARTITPSGMEAILDARDAAGLLAASRSWFPTVRPGQVPIGHGVAGFTFTIGAGADAVVVSAADPASFEPLIWRIPPQMAVLSALGYKLAEPGAWLPASAWTGPARPYAPERYLLRLTITPSVDAAQDLPDAASVAWPFAAPLLDTGAPGTGGGSAATGGERCLAVSPALAAQVSAAEQAAGGTDMARDLSQTLSSNLYRYQSGAAAGVVEVALSVLMPDQPGDCGASF
jgi:hypothetical protein